MWMYHNQHIEITVKLLTNHIFKWIEFKFGLIIAVSADGIPSLNESISVWKLRFDLFSKKGEWTISDLYIEWSKSVLYCLLLHINVNIKVNWLILYSYIPGIPICSIFPSSICSGFGEFPPDNTSLINNLEHVIKMELTTCFSTIWYCWLN